MEAIDFDTPERFAKHLAKYISCPSTIRAHCVRDWGKAPTLQEIVAMQDGHKKRVRTDIGEPIDADALMPRLGSIPLPRRRSRTQPAKPTMTPEQRQTLWPRWYQPPTNVFEVATLIDSVAGDFGFTRTVLVGEQKHPSMVHARAVIVRILKERGWSLPRIGRALGGRDHSTVSNAVRQYDVYVRVNPLVGMSYEAHKAAGWCGG